MKIVITPHTHTGFSFREMYQYKELIYSLILKEVKLRYRQTGLGIVWALMQPSVSSFIVIFIFSSLLRQGIQTHDYAVYVFLGMLFWIYFTQAISLGTNSYINNQSLITKMYIPRFLLPLALCMVPLVDFLVGYSAFIALSYFLLPVPFYRFSFIIIPLILLFIFVYSMSLTLAILNAKYRDVRYVLPFFIQLLFFVSPVMYPLSLIKAHQIFLFLNPMTLIIELSRFLIYPSYSINVAGVMVSCGVIIIASTLSIVFFCRYNSRLADYL